MNPDTKTTRTPAEATPEVMRMLVQNIVEQIPHAFSLRRRLVFAFLQGILYGTGFIFAIVLAIPMTIFFLQRIEWIPIVGDFVSQISIWLESQQTSSAPQ